jgi:hypothetical protein
LIPGFAAMANDSVEVITTPSSRKRHGSFFEASLN